MILLQIFLFALKHIYDCEDENITGSLFIDLIQKTYFLFTENTFLTVCIKPASRQNNRERGETIFLPLRWFLANKRMCLSATRWTGV